MRLVHFLSPEASRIPHLLSSRAVSPPSLSFPVVVGKSQQLSRRVGRQVGRCILTGSISPSVYLPQHLRKCFSLFTRGNTLQVAEPSSRLHDSYPLPSRQCLGTMTPNQVFPFMCCLRRQDTFLIAAKYYKEHCHYCTPSFLVHTAPSVPYARRKLTGAPSRITVTDPYHTADRTSEARLKICPRQG